MKAVILHPSVSPERLDPLGSWFPELLIPVVNKPIAAHAVEFCAVNKISEVIIFARRGIAETAAYFGEGERWGVRIRCFDGTESFSLETGKTGDEPILFVRGNAFFDIESSLFREKIALPAGGVSLIIPSVSADVPPLPEQSQGAPSPEDFPFILDPSLLPMLSESAGVNGFSDIPGILLKSGCSVADVRLSFLYRVISSPEDFAALSSELLVSDFSRPVLSGKTTADGIRIGRKTRIDPRAVLTAPCLIGSNCVVSEGASVGPLAVIGDNVVIDRNASVEDSTVFSDTYVGSGTEIAHALVNRNCYINHRRKELSVCVEDPAILGSLEKQPAGRELKNIFSILRRLFGT